MTDRLPWWRTDNYDGEAPLPAHIEQAAGPHGVALVRAWPSGITDRGWGLQGPASEPDNGFIQRYPRGEFNARRVLYGYERDKWAFALVMRSVNLVCIDIDGKNGGLEHAKRLGVLPVTMSETSKSGDGYHLFYLTDDTWSTTKGFGKLGDRIGIEQGVDIRATGCVYHHKQQRWNGRAPVLLPDYLEELLLHRDQKVAASNARIATVLHDADPMEVLMMHDELVSELNKPIPGGKRNQTLYAIGCQMKLAEVEAWDDKLRVRGEAVGLPPAEVEKLISNIDRYQP